MSSNFSLFTCFSPRRVYNARLGREVVTSCGSCAYCLALKSADHTNRVKREFVRNGESLCLFLTLTYDNDHLPVYQYNGKYRRWISNIAKLDPRYEHIKSDEVYIYPAPEGYYKGKEVKRSDARNSFRRNDRATFAHLYYPDVQDFIARVRTKFHHLSKRSSDSDLHKALNTNKIDYETLRFRYAVCGEYGPSSFRPHYHILLWFRGRFSDRAISELSKIISSAWSYGLFDCQTATSDGLSCYLASYISSLSSLPNVLKTKYLRPFFHFSQSPTLGVVSLDEDQVREILCTGDAFFYKYDEREQKRVIVEYPRSTMCRYFPRCQGFGYEDNKRTLSRLSYVYNYYRSSGVQHTSEQVDDLRLRDIPFPVRFVKDCELDYYEMTGKDTQRIGKDGMWHWPREDKYSSLVVYRYCVKFGLTPDLVLDAFRRIYSRSHSRRLGRFYEAVNLAEIELKKAVNFDPFVLRDLADGTMCTSVVSSYLGKDLDEYIEVSDVLAECSDNLVYDSHVGNYSHISENLVKKKKINDYKLRKKPVLRVFLK